MYFNKMIICKYKYFTKLYMYYKKINEAIKFFIFFYYILNSEIHGKIIVGITHFLVVERSYNNN
jgi:hypothetical protein